jgi:phospholipase C
LQIPRVEGEPQRSGARLNRQSKENVLILSQLRTNLLARTAAAMLFVVAAGPSQVLAAGTRAPVRPEANDLRTTTPIQHVIVIVGENRSYDHLLATYAPANGSTFNLLSQGIINADGSPGPNVALATQYKASDTDFYSISPAITKSYRYLPIPTTGGAHQTASDTNPPPFATAGAARAADYGLEDAKIVELTTGATGLAEGSPDTRIPNALKLPNAPYPLTGLADAYMNGPVHRFFQSWQQADCNIAYATASNPAGCRNDLFPWVEVTDGFGEGASADGFYNVQQGDSPYFLSLANTFAIGDNYHQPVRGGTGANSIMLGFGDLIYYSDPDGNPAVPPANQIENPDPKPGTNNKYINDGYSAGSYVNCSDDGQPGVHSIRAYLSSLPYHPEPNCEANAYYLVNNYNPGYRGDGSLETSEFTIPPVITPSIGDDLSEHSVSWAYYGEDWDRYVAGTPNAYCNICNPFQYQTQFMTDPKQRMKHFKDTLDLYAAIEAGKLPAVSFVKPSGLNDGHPTNSKWDIFEAFTKKIIDKLQANPKLYAHTAVFITTDEAGGYYDSGYTHPLDFFGDGNRIPLIVVSPYSQGVGVVHSYSDHVSILKFIEANWSLPPITGRSRDNLPNPQYGKDNPYVPINGAAIGDLMEFFRFGK